MAKVTKTKLKENNLLFEIIFGKKEKQTIRNAKKIFLFSKTKIDKIITIASRGRGGASKYALFPKEWKNNTEFLKKINYNNNQPGDNKQISENKQTNKTNSSNKVNKIGLGCKQIETEDSLFLIVSIDK